MRRNHLRTPLRLAGLAAASMLSANACQKTGTSQTTAPDRAIPVLLAPNGFWKNHGGFLPFHDPASMEALCKRSPGLDAMPGCFTPSGIGGVSGCPLVGSVQQSPAPPDDGDAGDGSGDSTTAGQSLSAGLRIRSAGGAQGGGGCNSTLDFDANVQRIQIVDDKTLALQTGVEDPLATFVWNGTDQLYEPAPYDTGRRIAVDPNDGSLVLADPGTPDTYRYGLQVTAPDGTTYSYLTRFEHLDGPPGAQHATRSFDDLRDASTGTLLTRSFDTGLDTASDGWQDQWSYDATTVTVQHVNVVLAVSETDRYVFSPDRCSPTTLVRSRLGYDGTPKYPDQTWTFDPMTGFTTSIDDGQGHVTRMVPGADGRLSEIDWSVENDDSSTAVQQQYTITYCGNLATMTVHGPNGYVSTETSQAGTNLPVSISTAFASAGYAYDDSSRLATVTDGATGQTVAYGYYGSTDVLQSASLVAGQKTVPLYQASAFNSAAFAFTHAVLPLTGATATLVFDALGQLTSIDDGATLTAIARFWDSAGYHEQLSLNGQLQVDTVRDGLGRVVQRSVPGLAGSAAPGTYLTSYYANGLVQAVTAPNGSGASFAYDQNGRPQAVTANDDAPITIGYGLNDVSTSVTSSHEGFGAAQTSAGELSTLSWTHDGQPTWAESRTIQNHQVTAVSYAAGGAQSTQATTQLVHPLDGPVQQPPGVCW